MTKQEIFQLINQNPVFHLATIDEDKPRVRGMLLFRADEDGIIFHTADSKDVYKQIEKNHNVELCFNAQAKQVRVSGVVERVYDEELKKEIYEHPTRKFLRDWEEQGITGYEMVIYRLKNGKAVEWTLDTNFDKKKPVQL